MDRNPATDPRPGDALHYADSTWTVEEVGADGIVYFTDGSNMALSVYSDAEGAWTYTPGPDDTGGPFALPAEGAPSPDDLLDVVERHARTLTALLTAAQLAASTATPTWARGPAEAWLRGQFEALGGGTAPAERDPRTDPRAGDTKTWWENDHLYTQTVTVDYSEYYAVRAETVCDGQAGVEFDDLTLEDWGRGLPTASWACGAAGASDASDVGGAS